MKEHLYKRHIPTKHSSNEAGAIVVFLAISLMAVVLACAIAIDWSNYTLTRVRAKRAGVLGMTSLVLNNFQLSYPSGSGASGGGGSGSGNGPSGGSGGGESSSGGGGGQQSLFSFMFMPQQQQYNPDNDLWTQTIDYNNDIENFKTNRQFAAAAVVPPTIDESRSLKATYERQQSAYENAALPPGSSSVTQPGYPNVMEEPTAETTNTTLIRLNLQPTGVEVNTPAYTSVSVSSEVSSTDAKVSILGTETLGFLASSLQPGASLPIDVRLTAGRSPVAISFVVDSSGSMCNVTSANNPSVEHAHQDVTGLIRHQDTFPTGTLLGPQIQTGLPYFYNPSVAVPMPQPWDCLSDTQDPEEVFYDNPQYRPVCNKTQALINAMDLGIQYLEPGTDFVGMVEFYGSAKQKKLTAGPTEPTGMIQNFDMSHVRENVIQVHQNHNPPSTLPQIRRCPTNTGEPGNEWYADGYTNIAEGLRQARLQFKNATPAIAKGVQKVIFLLSDGAPTDASASPTIPYLRALYEASEATKEGIRIVGVGLGTLSTANCSNPYQNENDPQSVKDWLFHNIALTEESTMNPGNCTAFPSTFTYGGNTYKISTPLERKNAGNPIGSFLYLEDPYDLVDYMQGLIAGLTTDIVDSSPLIGS